jgi:DNA-directed RNA polymerase subunit F
LSCDFTKGVITVNALLEMNDYQETVQKKIRDIQPEERVSMQKILAELVKTTIINVETKEKFSQSI